MDVFLQQLHEIAVTAAAVEEKWERGFQELREKTAAFFVKADAEKTPNPKGKRVKQLPIIHDDPESELEQEPSDINASSNSDLQGAAALRPSRSLRSKAPISFKEPKLNTKLRRPESIKKERVSEEGKENMAPNSVDEGVVALSDTDEQDTAAKKTTKPTDRKRKSNDEGFGSGHSETAAEATKKVKLSDGIEVVDSPDVPVEISDDEADKMPPPSMPPPKPRGRPRTRNATKKSSADVTASDMSTRNMQIKQERISSVNNSMPPPSVRSTRTKGKKKQEPAVPAPILEAVVKIEKISTEKLDTIMRPSQTPSDASVYEDAIANTGSRQNSKSAEVPSSDATFTKPNTPNTTTTIENATFAIPASNETFQVQTPESVNGTYTVPTVGSATAPSHNIHDSIMTEDRSDDDSPLQKPKATKPALLKIIQSDSAMSKNTKPSSKKHEIFNPIIPSPVKAKVQAYEKHAANAMFMSPAKTRFNSKNPVITPNVNSKLATPLTLTKIGSQRLVTPTQGPVMLSTLQKEKSASTSKLAHIQKKLTGSTPKLSSLSAAPRDPSVEDLKRTAAAIEEKKKKREEKQRLAQMQREQIEKERRERMEMATKEKEEKYKKALQEKEERKRELMSQKKLEEHMRNQKILEQKRRELLEKQELESLKSKHNDSLQRRVLQKQMQKNLKHDFMDLDTDDSTDDEGKSNKKLGVPPIWSKGSVRREILNEQNCINLNIIDSFFSVQPMTPDLKEIFPTIDSRKLKRNSSAYWQSPPRYSQLPKY